MKRAKSPALAAALALMLAGAIAGCSDSSGSTPTTATPGPAPAPASGGSVAAPAGSQVEINNFAFTPATLTVPAGTSVSWKFDDSTQHTVTADDNSFTSAAMGGGQIYTHTFGTQGTFAYHCSIHPFMKGSVEVK